MLKDCKLLLVDDETAFVETLQKRLTRRGLSVLTASNGPDALKLVEAHEIDVMVCDVKMPGMDGIEVLSQAKKLRPQLEVIMLTGHASVDVALQGMELGAFDYLMKPADFDELLYKIEDAYNKKKLA